MFVKRFFCYYRRYLLALICVCVGIGAITALAAATNSAGSVTRSATVTVANVPPPLPSDATFYVSPTGSDSNPGAQDRPFSTTRRRRRPPNQPPTVSVAASLTSGTAPLAVSFSAQGSDPDGSIVSYQWSFGDGNAASGSNINHTYQSAGVFTSKVAVTDNAGAVASASIVINVSAPTPPPPTLPTISSFTASPGSITSGQSSVLSWSVTGATGLSLDPGAITVIGLTSRSVTLSATTTYTLT